jgi:ATP-dependent Clp protease ATP-binding subunit ClpB
MRLDKLTTKFQQALADAQSLASGTTTRSSNRRTCCWPCCSRKTGRPPRCWPAPASMCRRSRRRLSQAIGRLPKVEGHGGEVQVGRDLTNLLNVTDKEAQKRGDQFIASEMFLLALCDDKGECGRLAKQHGLVKAIARAGGGFGARWSGCR